MKFQNNKLAILIGFYVNHMLMYEFTSEANKIIIKLKEDLKYQTVNL